MAGGVRDQSYMAATRHETRGNAREPDGGTPGCPYHWQQEVREQRVTLQPHSTLLIFRVLCLGN